ncbi:MAG: leucine-rich repeat protein [Bacteroidaceae bacterium]|nr:leucine-rich repeat protein [Bacteroidaceae bacterium]
MQEITFSSGLISEEFPFESKTALDSRGSTSLTYRVTSKGKTFFLKELRPEYCSDWRFRAAYHKEYEVGRMIQSKYVVKYLKMDENERGVYLLMEYVNGQTIHQRLCTQPEYFTKKGNFEKLFVQLLTGIGALHDAHVAYLDLNPENVMLTQVNNDVVIIDLGFCFADSYTHTSGCTQEFAAPELKEGLISEVDASTDIYAVGRLMQHIGDIAGVKISRHLQQVIDRCVCPNKQGRYDDVQQVIYDIQHKRHVLKISLAIGVLLVCLLGGGAYFMYSEHFAKERMYLEWRMADVDYDIEDRGNYYRILSEDSLTCMAVGGERLDNLNLYAEIPHQGKTYRTVGIGNAAFPGRDIQLVYIPDGVREIGDEAFKDCHHILTLNIPESVEKIGAHCFESLKSLTYLSLSSNLKVIPTNAFAFCESLKRVIIPEGVEVLELDAFALCTGLQKVTLPSTLKSIKRGVFWRCRRLKEITIPASVKTIGECVFYDCDSLMHVYCESPEPPKIGPIFNHKGIKVHVPKGAKHKYQTAPHWNYTTVVEEE